VSAPPRRSVQEIVNALLKYEGNVSAVADEFGMRRGSLYERLERLGIDPKAFRFASSGHVSGMTGMSGNKGTSPGVSGMTNEAAVVRKNEGGRYTGRGEIRRLTSVTNGATAAAAQPETDDAAFGGKPARLTGAQKRMLREAKFDWQARFRVEIQESGILQQFFEERFEEWIGSKLSTPAKKSKDAK
jgi:hypothetical protein